MDAVQNKSIPAWKLVSSLKELIAVGRSDRTYPKWSDRFLSFCERAADATARYLKEQPAATAHDEATVLLQPSSAIIKAWELLHTFIKPVLDADNLKVPYPLVQFLTENVGKLSKVSDAKFVIEISPQLTYYQHQHTSLRKTAFFLRALVGGPPIEERLGFLALPCLQAKSLFLNCLLYHEVGHYIAEETGLLLSPVERVELHNELRDAFRMYFEHGAPDQQEKSLSWAVQTVEQLIEEVFADLIAVRLVGLGYTLSYLELLRLADLSQEECRAFYIDHPADAFRLREQLKVLNNDGWDKYGGDLPHWKHMTSVANTGVDESLSPSKYYAVPSDYRDDEGMSQFWRILIDHVCSRERITSIHNKVDTLLADRDNPFVFYGQYKDGIEKCLAHGVVPSRKEGGSMPHPLAIINGGVIFLLSKMDDLHRTVQGGPEEFIAKRAFLEGRVEMWCLKAIDDWLVKRQQKIKDR